MASSGGVAAAFGFRYQYLVTVGIILDLYEEPGLTSWTVDVDLGTQDSADILVCKGGNGWDVAVQVKASQPGASTTMGVPDVANIFDALRTEHPRVPDRRLVTNRTLTQELSNDVKGSLWSQQKGETFTRDHPGLTDLVRTLLTRVSALRQRGAGGLHVHHILLAQLIDLVHQRGSDSGQQQVTHSDVAAILAEPAAVLADAARERNWGRTINAPHGQPVSRPDIDKFLESHLPLDSLLTGVVNHAALSGFSGTGKSSAALKLTQDRIENYALVLWLDASSDTTLQAQLPRVLRELGAPVEPGDPAEVFITALSQVPLPWMLVLDNAADIDSALKWVPHSGYGHVVLTSTSTTWSSADRATAVKGFSVPEARSFFAARFNAPVADWTSKQAEAFDELARRLEYWPLALVVATAWIKQHNAGLGQISDFVDRLDRLDLDDGRLLPYGYPTTASRVVRELLEDLTSDAKTLADGIAAMGGHQVPVPLLRSWTAKLGVGAEVFDELLRHGIVTWSLLPDQRRPHDYDESAQMHDAIRLILGSLPHGFPIDFTALHTLVEVCAEHVHALAAGERYIEAAAILPPIDELLARCLSSVPPTSVPGRWTTLMHNVGSLAQVIDTTIPDPRWAMRISRRWLASAVNIRSGLAADANPAALAALQVETLGTLAYVLQRLDEDDELLDAAVQALEYGEPHGAALNEVGTTVPEALRMIREALNLQGLEGQGFQKRLQDLEDLTRQSQGREIVTTRLDTLQADMFKAVDIVDQGSLEEGVDLALRATRTAFTEGILASRSIDCLLDIGIFLLATVASQPADPGLPRTLIGRVLDGLAPFADRCDPSQRARMNVLSAVATGDPETLHQAILHEGAPSEGDREILVAWVGCAEIIAAQYAREAMFANVPEGIHISRFNDELRYREAVDQGRNVPMLFVYSTGSVGIDSEGRHPSGHLPFIAAGLVVTTDPAGVLPVAQGWYLRFQGAELWIYSSDDQPLVQEIAISDGHADYIRRAGGLLLVYRDFRLSFEEILTAPAGWIPYTQSSPRRGWRRWVPWWLRGGTPGSSIASGQ